MQVYLDDTPHNLVEADYQALGRRTKGFSGSDIEVVVNDVLMQPIRLLHEATHFRWAESWAARDKPRSRCCCRCRCWVAATPAGC